jgi:hypothetical protein
MELILYLRKTYEGEGEREGGRKRGERGERREREGRGAKTQQMASKLFSFHFILRNDIT